MKKTSLKIFIFVFILFSTTFSLSVHSLTTDGLTCNDIPSLVRALEQLRSTCGGGITPPRPPIPSIDNLKECIDWAYSRDGLDYSTKEAATDFCVKLNPRINFSQLKECVVWAYSRTGLDYSTKKEAGDFCLNLHLRTDLNELKECVDWTYSRAGLDYSSKREASDFCSNLRLRTSFDEFKKCVDWAYSRTGLNYSTKKEAGEFCRKYEGVPPRR